MRLIASAPDSITAGPCAGMYRVQSRIHFEEWHLQPLDLQCGPRPLGFGGFFDPSGFPGRCFVGACRMRFSWGDKGTMELAGWHFVVTFHGSNPAQATCAKNACHKKRALPKINARSFC